MVRKAEEKDIPVILNIYASARRFMAENGNPTQWGDRYPIPEQIIEDLEKERLYVVCDRDDRPYGVFAFVLGEEPAYAAIQGKWLNRRPYGTIHRLASAGREKGVFAQCLDFCKGICPDIRADTHRNNHPMQHLLKKYGFVYCGTVNLDRQEGETERLAYQYEGSH